MVFMVVWDLIVLICFGSSKCMQVVWFTPKAKLLLCRRVSRIARGVISRAETCWCTAKKVLPTTPTMTTLLRRNDRWARGGTRAEPPTSTVTTRVVPAPAPAARRSHNTTPCRSPLRGSHSNSESVSAPFIRLLVLKLLFYLVLGSQF